MRIEDEDGWRRAICVKDLRTVLYGYEMPPMDFGWHMLPTVRDYLDKDGAHGGDDRDRLLRLVERGYALGVECGWFAGDGEMHVVVLPDQPWHRLALVWKQSSKGTTFVVSESPLPWLDRRRAIRISARSTDFTLAAISEALKHARASKKKQVVFDDGDGYRVVVEPPDDAR